MDLCLAKVEQYIIRDRVSCTCKVNTPTHNPMREWEVMWKYECIWIPIISCFPLIYQEQPKLFARNVTCYADNRVIELDDDWCVGGKNYLLLVRVKVNMLHAQLFLDFSLETFSMRFAEGPKQMSVKPLFLSYRMGFFLLMHLTQMLAEVNERSWWDITTITKIHIKCLSCKWNISKGCLDICL